MVLDYICFSHTMLRALDKDVALMLHDDGTVMWGTYNGYTWNEKGDFIPNVDTQSGS